MSGRKYATIEGVATRLADFEIPSKDVFKYFDWWLPGKEDQEFVQKLIDRGGIERRFWSMNPKDYYTYEDEYGVHPKFIGFGRRMADWRAVALKHGVEIAKELLGKVGAKPTDIDILTFNSVTGWAVPDVPAMIAKEIGAKHNIRRTQVLAMGCYGLTTSIVRNAEALETGRYKGYAINIASELYSFDFQAFKQGIREYEVANILFGDGSAGIIMRLGGNGPKVIDWETYDDYNTFNLMTYELSEEGMDFILDKRVPEVIEQTVHIPFERVLKRNSMKPEDVTQVLAHPGGKRVIEAVYKGLNRDMNEARFSFDVYRKYGNLSSATIGFVLKEFLESGKWDEGDYVALVTNGPGLTSDVVILQM